LFEFLFKYRPVAFERGELTLAVPGWTLTLVLAAIAALVWFLLRYRRVASGAGGDVTTRAAWRTGIGVEPRAAWILGSLRVAVLGVVAFALMRPTLVVSTVVPRHNYLAVLLDDSRSMRVADETVAGADGASRGTRLLELFGSADDGPSSGDGELRRALAERFRLRAWSFGADAAPLDRYDALGFADARTSLGRALSRVRQEMDGLPLSGIVLVTDGADNGDASIEEAITELRAAGVPVHVVALGEERIVPDVEVRRVELPRRALVGTTVVADVVLSHAGLAGRTVRVEVADDGRLLGRREVELGVDGETAAQVQLALGEPGARQLDVRVAPIDGEAVTENNARSVLLDVTGDARRILYFEGVPRPELKFVRRAVAGDERLRLVTLLRSADEKYLRLGVDDPDELLEGFPTTREELYGYDGLVLGDVEASFFTHDQLQMMADFVARRGGGLLALGGTYAFAEGGYAGTPLAGALPVVLDDTDDRLVELRAELTPAGRRHPAIRIANDEAASADRWAALPPVTTLNLVTRVKPGAVTLATGQPGDGGDPRVLVATQRFGRGRSAAFVTQDSWLWQMHADIPLEDQTHETLWRQLLRWLVNDTPGRLELDLAEDAAPPGEPVTLRATLEDERFLRVNGAAPAATVVGPDGVPESVPLTWTVARDGEYEGTFVPPEPGLYRVEVSGPGTDSLTAVGWFRSGDARHEAFGAGRRTDLLRRVAEQTGGRFYTADRAGRLADEIPYASAGDTVREAHPLWDMPALLLLIGLLLSAEWIYRNRKELA
jgi:uncharacterized membrane protein